MAPRIWLLFSSFNAASSVIFPSAIPARAVSIWAIPAFTSASLVFSFRISSGSVYPSISVSPSCFASSCAFFISSASCSSVCPACCHFSYHSVSVLMPSSSIGFNVLSAVSSSFRSLSVSISSVRLLLSSFWVLPTVSASVCCPCSSSLLPLSSSFFALSSSAWASAKL